MTTVTHSSANQHGMLLLEPYQPLVFMEDDWDNSPSPPPLTKDEDDLFADMDFVDVHFSLPPTPSNSAPQSPTIPADKFVQDGAEELLNQLMQAYCPQSTA